MSTDAQRAIAAHDASLRALHGGQAPNPPSLSESISDALLMERMRAHGASPEDPGRRKGWEARQASKNVASKTRDQIDRIRRNPTVHAVAKEIQAGEVAEKTLKSHLEHLDVVIEHLEKQASIMQDEVEHCMIPESPNLRGMLPEARATFRTMTPAQRDKILSDTQNPDYYTIMYAVGSAPAWMSGVDEGQRIRIRDTILALRRPALLTLPTEYKRELADLKMCRDGFIRTFNEMVDFESVAAMKALAGGD